MRWLKQCVFDLQHLRLLVLLDIHICQKSFSKGVQIFEFWWVLLLWQESSPMMKGKVPALEVEQGGEVPGSRMVFWRMG